MADIRPTGTAAADCDFAEATAKNRLDCLRALNKQEIEQRILDRLAGLSGGENIPDEIIRLIFEPLAERVHTVEWATGDSDETGLTKACLDVLGHSPAARTLCRRVEELVLEAAARHFIPSHTISAGMSPSFREDLTKIRHLQLQVFLHPSESGNIPDWQAHVYHVSMVLNPTQNQQDNMLGPVQTLGIQLAIEMPHTSTGTMDGLMASVPQIAGHPDLSGISGELVSLLRVSKDSIKKQSGVNLSPTFQLRFDLSKNRDVIMKAMKDPTKSCDKSYVIQGSMVDVEDKSTDEILREACPQ